MLKALYILSVIILTLLTLLFVIATTIRLQITPQLLKVTVFHFPIIYLKNEKLYAKIIKMSAKNDNRQAFSPQYLQLRSFLHLDALKWIQGVKDRKDIEAILWGLKRMIVNSFPDSKIDLQIESGEWKTIIKIKFHFYIGTIILNYLLIRRRIKHGQTSTGIHSKYDY